MSLDAVGRARNTDKASSFVSGGVLSSGHDYLRHYEEAFARHQNAHIQILDLGVGSDPDRFASALAWVDYFPNAEIVAVDIEPNSSPHPRISFVQMDLSNPRNLATLSQNLHPTIVVEDASHFWTHQILSLLYLLPAIKPGGLYIWEDLHTSSPVNAGYDAGSFIAPTTLLSVLVDKVLLKDDARPATAYPDLGPLAPAELVDSLVPIIDSICVLRRSAIFRLKA